MVLSCLPELNHWRRRNSKAGGTRFLTSLTVMIHCLKPLLSTRWYTWSWISLLCGQNWWGKVHTDEMILNMSLPNTVTKDRVINFVNFPFSARKPVNTQWASARCNRETNVCSSHMELAHSTMEIQHNDCGWSLSKQYVHQQYTKLSTRCLRQL